MPDYIDKNPDVRIAALKREREALANKPYATGDPQATKDRRLSEIDTELDKLGAGPDKPARRERAVREG